MLPAPFTDRPWLRIAAVGGNFAFFYAGGLLLGRTVLPAVHLLTPTRADAVLRSRRVVSRATHFFFGLMKACRLLDFEPTRAAIRVPDGPFVLVANHPALIDSPAVISRFSDVTLLVKQSMFRHPMMRGFFQLTGHIGAGSESIRSRVEVYEQCLASLKSGFPLAIFPEGTRTDPDRVAPLPADFQRGAFRLACEADVPVIPLAIHTSPRALTGHEPWWDFPLTMVRYRMEQLEPHLPADYAHKDKALRDAVFRSIRQALE